ncbi:helix-turn-helix transcriptional regulator [Pseudomonas sp. PS02290]|uniref:helix-turn-helix transcriptional regulator n=1 Tax=Pseudomonas sp. PS02290 TaxID=2991430 RepID=UPI00249B629F|nr:helix-turn-helix transcriptional regulator [Pseudomonas sp. PS02290]
MKLQAESLILTETWWTDRGVKARHQAEPGSPQAKVFTFEIKRPPSSLAGRHSAFDDLLAELESSPASAPEMSEARTWVADRFYQGEQTIKAARLKKGLSQKQLASALNTSQPHVATIEKGCVDLMMSTAVKLCEVLGIEMNDLPRMLEAQKAMTEGKGKK